jgi:nicotinamidase/pyrazinamidase
MNMLKTLRKDVASIDVDAQKGFTPLCPNELPVVDGDKIVEELNKQAVYAYYRCGSKDAHPANPVWLADKDHAVLSKVEGYDNADLYWPAHCVVGTRGFELLDGLPKPEGYDFFVWKGMEPHLHPYGACFHDQENSRSTGLIEWLVDRKVSTVIVGGLATDYCVYATCQQLLEHGFKVILNTGASKAVDPGSVAAKVYELRKIFNETERGQMFHMVSSADELGQYIRD